MVTDSWVGGIGIGQVEGENTFLGIMAGPREPSPIIDPIVLEGRLPQASPDPDVIEVVLARGLPARGRRPDGHRVPRPVPHRGGLLPLRHRVRGRGGPRARGGGRGGRHGAPGRWRHHDPADLRERRRASSRTPTRSSAACYFVRLDGGAAGFEDFAAAVEDLVGDRTLPPEAAEFSVVDVSDTAIAAAAVDNTAVLLGRALMLFALSTAVVGGFAVVQALARHHTASAGAREVEQALGLTRGAADRRPPAHRPRSRPALATVARRASARWPPRGSSRSEPSTSTSRTRASRST